MVADRRLDHSLKVISRVISYEWIIMCRIICTASKSLLLLLLLIAIQPASASAGVVSGELQEFVRQSRPGETIPVIIRLRDRVDPSELARDSKRRGQTSRFRRGRLVRELKAQGLRPSNRQLMKLLRAGGGKRMRELWVINAVAAEVPVELVVELSSQPQVLSVRYDAR